MRNFFTKVLIHKQIGYCGFTYSTLYTHSFLFGCDVPIASDDGPLLLMADGDG